ncbi:hypothetical protein LVJ83_08250 [Uruburuella testudinis]|uniref:Uncharacterized protein n=1 Tax=Uruburuella testudinis TaxID=1282863 RepID=A0ABY4DPJ2_9NEIS|nr:hypothetical protein [Uruburuella testudinis]UOO80974.1 hypothetical protein LVJ83_08250 [Uruburuella testudinis]
MALHPTQIFEALEKLVQEPDRNSFIYEFLRIFDTPKSTITKLKKGDAASNVADNIDCGAVALKQRLYFQPVGGGGTTWPKRWRSCDSRLLLPNIKSAF